MDTFSGQTIPVLEPIIPDVDIVVPGKLLLIDFSVIQKISLMKWFYSLKFIQVQFTFYFI